MERSSQMFGIVGLMIIATVAPTSAQVDEWSVQTDRFELHSQPRVTLHHFLTDWASADAGEWPPYALPIVERENWQSALTEREREVWAAAVDAYGFAVGRSYVFDEGLVRLRDWAAGVKERSTILAADRPLANALDSALPVYEKYWWSSHHEQNRAWVEALSTQLDAAEDDMVERFEVAYGGSWPESRIPIDVVVYANDVGAYSTGGRLTISSRHRGNEMPFALEMVFHEASHVDEMEVPLRQAIQQAFEAAGVDEPERFWHDVIFFTSGDITRLELAERGQPDYEHYGSFGVYRRAERWRVNLPALERHWRPFLESAGATAADRRQALRRVAEQVGNRPRSPRLGVAGPT